MCGAEHRKQRRACSAECAARLKEREREASAKVCPVCGTRFWGQRATCSDGCAKTRAAAFQVRVPGSRAARKRHTKGYRGKDKAAVVARLALEQGGRCAVCGSPGRVLGDGTVGLVLDHSHATGRPRALLCTHCNAALGMLWEDPRVISRLSEYAAVSCDKRPGKRPDATLGRRVTCERGAPREVVAVRLDASERDRLEQLATALGLTRSAVICEALAQLWRVANGHSAPP